jgi:hypothetical protein
LEKDVNVIFCAPDGMHENFLFLADTCHVSPQFGLEVGRNELSSIFGAEDNVDQIVRIGVRHWVIESAGAIWRHNSIG